MNPYEIGTMADSLYNSYEHYFGKRDRPMQSIPLRAFHNALRILNSLDYHDVSFLTHDKQGWLSFRDNPYTFFITTSDANAARIWAAIQKRQPQELRQDKLASTLEGESNG
jgi:hypothetical protein